MARFVRRDIPYLSCDDLIARLDYDLVMKDKILHSEVRNYKRLKYHNNNEGLLKHELERREGQGDPVRWFRAKWRSVYDMIDMIEKDINETKERVEELKSKECIEKFRELNLSNFRNDMIDRNEKEIYYFEDKVRLLKQDFM